MQNEKITQKLDALLDKLAARDSVHSLAMAVETGDGRLSWRGAAGRANSAGDPMTPERPYLIASVTKLYIAAATLRLCESGTLDLDEPLAGYLPPDWLAGLHVYRGEDCSGRIRLRHLLHHASGLPDWLEDGGRDTPSLFERLSHEDDRTMTLEDVAAYTRRHLSPHFPPQDMSAGKYRIRYSDTNFQLLMAALEAVTGKSIEQVFQELIFQPLGLGNTFHPGNLPVGTPEPASLWIGGQVFDRPLWLRSFRDLYSTLDDQLVFLRGLLGGELFERPETVRQLYAHWASFGVPRRLSDLRQPNWPIQYGLGMMRFAIPRWLPPFRAVPAVIGHTGSTGSWLFYCPEQDLYLCGGANQATAAALPFRVLPELLGICALRA